MGRYVYDASLVTQALDELNSAVNSLADINTEIQSGINTINSATGANCIDVDYTKLLELKTLAEDVVEEDIRTIQEKVAIIEDYEQAPWYKKVFASVGMALTKFGEGVVSAIEDLGDGVVSIAGFVGGIFNSEFKEACGEYIKKDHVGDWFDEQYENGALSSIQAYSYYSKDSTAANIFKGIGCAAPYVALSMTGVGLVTETVAAGVSGIGSGTEAGLQEGKTYNQAFASGLWQGTKNAALVYGMGKLAQGIQAGAANKSGQLIAGSADDFAKLTSGSADEVASTAKTIFNSTDDLVATPLTNSAGKITGYRLNSATSLEVVGDITMDGTNAIVRSFGNSGTATATRVLASSGDEILYNVIKNTDDLVGTSFDDLVKATNLTTSEKVFSKAGEFGDTKVGQALNASDDALSAVGSKVANSKVGQLVTNTGSKIINSTPVQAVVNSNLVQKVSTAVANTVASHPVATFGAAATLFTADQIDEQETGTEYRLANELGVITPNPQPTLPNPTVTTPEITIITTTITTTVTTPIGTTPTATTPSNGGGGGGYTTVVTPTVTTPTVTTPEVTTPTETTPTVTTPTVTTPTVTTPEVTTPTETTPTETTPTVTTPTVTTPTVNPGTPSTTTPSSGGGGYTGGGYTSETPETGEEVTLPEGEILSGSFAELIGGSNEYTKIPTSAAPITTTTTTGTKKSIIPVIAGLSAAAVAGIGTKAYLDKKEQGDVEEDVDAEEWTEDSLDVDYNDAMEQEGDYLDPSDEYAYQEDGEPAGSYEAVNSSELASMQ